MIISEFPLEILQGILDFAFENSSPSEIVQLRLINRLFDLEILRAYSRSTLFMKNLEFLETTSRDLRLFQSQTDFYAKCFIYHPESRRDSSFSLVALFNSIANALSNHADSVPQKDYLKALCREFLKNAFCCLPSSEKKMAKCLNRNIKHHVCIVALKLGEYSLAQQILQDVKDISEIHSELLVHENILLMAMKMDQLDFVRYLLDHGFDMNDHSYEYSYRRILEEAVLRDRKYVELILLPQYRYDTGSVWFQEGIICALKVNNIELAEFMLQQSSVPLSELKLLLYWGPPAACQVGALSFLKLLVEDTTKSEPETHGTSEIKFRGGDNWWGIRSDFQDTSRDLVTLAAWKGHANIIRYLLSNGANPDGDGSRGEPMIALVWEGHLHVAKILLEAGGLRLSPGEWIWAFGIASWLPSSQSENVVGWIFDQGLFDINEAKKDSSLVAKLADCIRWASAFGNLGYVKQFVKHGFPITDKTIFDTEQDTFPTVYAKARGCEDVLQYLVDLGVPNVDPLDTPLRDRAIKKTHYFCEEEEWKTPKCHMPRSAYA